jgi:hypothetical protein
MAFVDQSLDFMQGKKREGKKKKAKASDYLNWIKFCLAAFKEILLAL